MASVPGRYQPSSFQSYIIRCQPANINSKDDCHLDCDEVLPGINLLTNRCLSYGMFHHINCWTVNRACPNNIRLNIKEIRYTSSPSVGKAVFLWLVHDGHMSVISIYVSDPNQNRTIVSVDQSVLALVQKLEMPWSQMKPPYYLQVGPILRT